MSLFVGDLILYIETLNTPQHPPQRKKLLELINKFSNVAGLKKNNIQKLVAFLYTNNELSEKEIGKIIPFTVATKRIK